MLRNWKFELQIDEQSDQAIYLQIADAILQDIYSGRLKVGDALPGSRSIAKLLNVNRNTVVEALQVLLLEGWLISKERQGTFVADTLPQAHIKRYDDKVDNASQAPSISYSIQFDDGSPDSKIAPITELARAYRQIFKQNAKWQMMGYGHELGDLDFRRALVQMLNHQRGMQAHEDQICITRGSQMAMYLTAQCLFEKNDYVIIENPGYAPAWKVFQHAGAKLLPAKVDQEGVCIEDILHHLKSGKKIRALYVTPHRQYPTTATLSLKRRLEIIKLSNQYNFTIIEDDYDHEFHFGYRPILPLSSFAALKNYIYLGTLSKVVAPAMRIGYLVCHDPSLIQKVGYLRKIIDVQGDNMMERAVLQLIKDGTLKRHIKKATLHYKSKRDFTAQLLNTYMKEKATFVIPEGGLAFWIVPKHVVDWTQLSQKLNNKRIHVISPHTYSFDETGKGIRLGYGSLSEKELELGVQILSKLL